mmetsp:Transcript_13401/g.40562  ORF Transcript_13401/g.40562 Transcript_13401/m.40562 type:complete len:233 (-) Transcript_13401:159-857(-)
MSWSGARRPRLPQVASRQWRWTMAVPPPWTGARTAWSRKPRPSSSHLTVKASPQTRQRVSAASSGAGTLPSSWRSFVWRAPWRARRSSSSSARRAAHSSSKSSSVSRVHCVTLGPHARDSTATLARRAFWWRRSSTLVPKRSPSSSQISGSASVRASTARDSDADPSPDATRCRSYSYFSRNLPDRNAARGGTARCARSASSLAAPTARYCASSSSGANVVFASSSSSSSSR